MIIIPLLVNMLVISALAFGLVATAMGMVTADQLLVYSALSGFLTLLSFKLSKEAQVDIEGELKLLETEEDKESAGSLRPPAGTKGCQLWQPFRFLERC